MTEQMNTVRRTKAYLVQMSRGEPVQIDQEELPKVIASMQSGKPCVLKCGIVNPSYITSVVPDGKRMEAFVHDCRYDSELRTYGMKPLAELISRYEVLAQIGNGQHRLLGDSR